MRKRAAPRKRIVTQTILNLDSITTLASVFSYNTTLHALAYKPVAKKVCAVIGSTDKSFHVTCVLPDSPLAGLKPLPTHPPDFIPGEHFT